MSILAEKDPKLIEVFDNFAFDFLHAANEVLEGQSTTTVETRFEKGLEIVREAAGNTVDNMLETMPQMKGNIRNNLRICNDKHKLLDTITVLLPLIGYPRTLPALNCLNEVAPEES